MKVRAEVVCRFLIEYEDENENNVNIITESIELSNVKDLAKMQIDGVEIIQVNSIKPVKESYVNNIMNKYSRNKKENANDKLNIWMNKL